MSGRALAVVPLVRSFGLSPIVLSGVLLAQSVTFTEQLDLLDESGIASPPFQSGAAVGVVDLDGDRRDDIVRFHETQMMSVELQREPGEPFANLFVGDLGVDRAWAVCAADIDRNGINDLLVAPFAEGVKLFRADEALTGYTGMVLPDQEILSQGTIFADLNLDGWPDVFACDDLDDPHTYRNEGDGTFTLQAGLLDTLMAEGNDGNYSMVQTDYDGDGDPDYYLSKCKLGEGSATSPSRINRLFENDGSGGFTEVPGAAGLASGAQSWCAAFADVDNDGDVDCFLLNHGGPSSEDSVFYWNDGSGGFTRDHDNLAGLEGLVTWPGLQAHFADYDNDGWVDLLVSSLALFRSQRVYGFFHNDGDGTFTREFDVLRFSNGVAVDYIHTFATGDLNRDGFLDLYAGRGMNVNLASGRSDLLLFNDAGNGNHFLSVHLVGQASNPNGIGAWIEAHGPWGVQVREVRGGEGYGIMNSLNAHFGLGEATAIDRLVVRWPSGAVDEMQDVAADRFVTLYEGTGQPALTFADWSGEFLPPGADAAGDPDQDGLGSLIEQILGTAPDQANGWKGLVTELVRDESQVYCEVSVDRVPTADSSLGLEFSRDGQTWQKETGLEILEDGPLRFRARLRIDPALDRTLLVRLAAELR